MFESLMQVMKAQTLLTLCPIYGIFDDLSGKLNGTGTLISHNGEVFVLTAAHVVHPNPEFAGFAYSAPGNPKLIATRSLTGRPLDLALFPVDSSLAADPGRQPVDVGSLPTTSFISDGEVLFVHGFPGERSYALADIYSKSLPYLSVPGVSQCGWFDPRIHFAVDYASEGLIDENGKAISMVHPGGMSGSAVWAVAPDASNSRIVGVVHAWDQASQSLIATRIEAVRDFILLVLRSRHAYSRWEMRGRPEADDWPDWFAALSALPSL